MARVRVLLAEDRQDTSRLLAAVLGAAGFQVASVPHEVLVAPVLVAEEVRVVVASFCGRGVGATAALLRELRSRPEPVLRDACVVAIVDDEVDAAFGIGTDADAVLVRPVDAGELVDAVTEVAASWGRDRRRRAGTHHRSTTPTTVPFGERQGFP